MNTPARLTGMKIFQLRMTERSLAASVAVLGLSVEFPISTVCHLTAVVKLRELTKLRPTRGTIEMSSRAPYLVYYAGASPSFSSRLTGMKFLT